MHGQLLQFHFLMCFQFVVLEPSWSVCHLCLGLAAGEGVSTLKALLVLGHRGWVLGYGWLDTINGQPVS